METVPAVTTYDDIPTPSAESSTKQMRMELEQEYQETLITVPPDGGWGWVVVCGAFFSFLIVDGMFYSFGVFLESMSQDLKCSKSRVSLSTAIITGVFCMSGPFAASLVNNYGYRTVGVVGSVVSIVACLVTSLAKTIYPVYFTYGVMGGIGFGMIYMPAVIAVGFYFERLRGIATGVSSCGAGLGGVLLPLVFSPALENLGWRTTFRILSAVFLLALVCSLLFKPVQPTRVQKIKINPLTSGNFFTTYHNRMYPTLSELTEAPTIILLQPRRFKSSEVMITTYPSSSFHFKARDEYIVEDPVVQDSKTGSEYQSIRTKGTATYMSRNRIVNPMRPMYRDDIFYNSSFNFLQRHKKAERISSQKTTMTVSSMEYHMSVTRVATQRDLDETGCRRALCTEAVKRTLATMLDYTLLKSPTFLLITLNATFVCLGYFTTYIFIEDRALQAGVPDEVASWLIPIIGVANITGRVICGFIATCPWVSCTWLSASCLILGGMATIVSVHFDDAGFQVSYAVIFGSFIACIPVLRTLIIVETLGLEKLTNAVGLILMFQGVACLAGLSLAGALRDATGDYKWSFYFSGGTIIVAALFFIPLQRVAKWERKRNDTAKQTQD